MRLRKPCEHDLYDVHRWWDAEGSVFTCPGGEFLYGDALVIPRDADGNWPWGLVDLLGEFGDPWDIQSVIEAFVEAQVRESEE